MSSLPSLLVLEKSRASMIFAALVLRKTTIVAKPEWKVLPWSHFPGRISSLKLLTDIVADCPELFVLREGIMQTHTNQSSQYTQLRLLLEKAWKIHANLYQWNDAWVMANGQAYIEVLPPITAPCNIDPSGEETPVWTSVFQFESLYHANALTLYHAILILILRFIAGVEVALGEVGDNSLSEQQIYGAGLFICRSVDYQLNQTWTEMGAFNVLFPLRMAYEAVGREQAAVGAWLQKALEDVSAGRRGLWKSAKAVLQIG
jgi:hypothetical protein